jgi:hypothetical protein
MKQTAVEWLYERLERMIPRTALYDIDKIEYFQQAKEIENQQKDDFTIEFAEWCLNSLLDGEEPKAKTMKELLEIFKNK